MKITFISTVPATNLALVAQEIQAEFRLDLDLKIYYPRTIDEEEVDEELLREDLKRSDAVFVDIRGEGHASEVVQRPERREEHRREPLEPLLSDDEDNEARLLFRKPAG